MLPLPYTLRAAYGRLAAYLKKLRAELPVQVRQRVVKGKTEYYLVRPKALSDGAQATARLLLVRAIDAVEQLRRVPLLLEPTTPDEAPAQRLPPPVATNNEELARARQVSARAIRDHLVELRKIGFIAHKTFRGTRANFELCIAPEFVWQQAPQNAPRGAKKRQIAVPAPPAPATNFPLIVSLERQDNKEIEIGLVEKLVSPPTPAGTGALTGNTGPQQPAKPALPPPARPRQATKEGRGGAGAAARPPAPPQAPSAERHAEHVALATQAWHYAWRRLYPTRRFDEPEQAKALQAIWHGVYRGFDGRLSEADYQRYHDQVLRRIDLAAAYFERYPNKFAPGPFAEFVRGTGYFDAENARGFIGTEEWLARQEANNRQRNIARALLKARQQLKAHRLGLAPKRTQALTAIQLFRYHETKLRALGPDALRRYYAQVAPPLATAPARPVASAIPATTTH